MGGISLARPSLRFDFPAAVFYARRMSTTIPGLRSPADQVGGLVYFGRMIDKIRLHHAGKLPPDWQPGLGKGFDERCVHFLRISYQALVDHVIVSPDASDKELLEWALQTGRHPDEEEIEVWSGFMSKRGWKDEASGHLSKRKAEGGFQDRADIETMFQFIDADEGRF